jgi:Holliday junction resolvase RusA-like endonuclease
MYVPCVNKHTHRPKIVLSKEGSKYKQMAAWLIVSQAPRVKFGKHLMNADFVTHAPDKRIRDNHNLEKILFDCFEASGIVDNDSQFVSHSMKPGTPVEGGKIEVSIEPYYLEY